MTKIRQNGYAYGTTPPCSACKENNTSQEAKCEAIINCLEPKWPCSGSCQTDCYNVAVASGPIISCADALITAACR